MVEPQLSLFRATLAKEERRQHNKITKQYKKMSKRSKKSKKNQQK